MSASKISIPIEQITAFCQHNHIRRLALFGSVVGEDFRPESDVDVLVDFQPEAPVGFLALSRMQRELSVLLQRTVDLVPQTGLKPVIRDSILASAQVVYAA